MKKFTKYLMTILGVVLAVSFASAQNYKAPKIDASGKITDKEGKYVGNVNSKGEITDTLGIKLAYVDSDGSLIDAKTGKKMGKAEKNGNFVPYFKSEKNKKGLTISPPMNGTCLVKDDSGKVVAEVHENYKQYGACAMHCMQNHMQHGEVLDNSKPKASKAYACPMHPEIVSDKPGKCSKCGMELIKK